MTRLDLPTSSRRRKTSKVAGCFLWIGVSTTVVVLIGTLMLWARLADDEPVEYDDPVEHFKYGSTGGERGHYYQLGFGIPYWVWIAMPELFPEYLPDGRTGRGWQSFGFLYEDGRDPRFDLPVGMSMRRVMGVDRVYFNCAGCHTGSIRATPESDPVYVVGMPANTFDLGGAARFLFEVGTDRKFSSDFMMAKIAELEELREEALPEDERFEPDYRPEPLGAIDRGVFRWIAVHWLRDQLLNLRGQLSFIDTLSWGPGRVDTFNSPKALLGFRMDNADPRELIGNADLPSVWFQAAREGMELHWDGNNTSLDERNLSAGFGTGATPTTLDKRKILRVADYLSHRAEPPTFPEERIDAAKLDQGRTLYQAYCWDCHGNARPPFEGVTVGTVVPIDDIGTDRWRLDSYTPKLASTQGSLYAGFPPAGEEACAGMSRDDPSYADDCYPARFHNFRKTNGYANMPLDGLWLRAPFLHNGSVPNLRYLLEPASERPEAFYRGDDVYDYDAVGFVHDVARRGERAFWLHDTTLPGNGNQGHEGPAYGTDLSPEEKDALVEYLKTF